MRRLGVFLLVSVMLGFGLGVVRSVVRPTSASGAPTFGPADIADEFVAGGTWTAVVAADFMPDGRMLLVRTNGIVYLATPSTGASAAHFTIPGVLSAGEAGLLDIVIDPNFATNNYFYTYLSDLATRRLRVDRFTFSASGTTTLASRTQIWLNPGPAMNGGDYHIGGSLNIGPDGKFYLSTGDNLTSSNSQTFNNVFGKVLRFNLDGTVPTDNPFYDGAGPNVDEIWAYGIRNGFRSSFDGSTYWFGDVGGNNAATAYEEINLIERGKNYGWPLCEGPLGLPKSGAVCPSGVEAPIHTYSHDLAIGCCANRAIVGGEVYRGNKFPPSFAGTYVFSDYATGEFFWLERNGATVTSGLLKTSVAHGGGVPVWIGVSPVDGHLYWLHYGFGNGDLRRLRYTGSLLSPPVVTQSTASVTSGDAPLSVTFAATATDADGDAVTYSWNFGDGESSATSNPTKIYTTPGPYSAQLTVTAAGDVVTAPPITIFVGTPPVATIVSPANNTPFQAGQTITATGSGTDADDGTLAPSALSWNVVFRHDQHDHPTTTGTGATIAIPVATTGHSWEGDTGYRVTLTATDSSGLTHSVTNNLVPTKVQIPVTSNIAVDLTVDGITRALPSNLDSIVGFQHAITAPVQRCIAGLNWNFNDWSSGASRDHTFTVSPSTPALVATYIQTGTCGPDVYRAVNINGPALTVNGVAFESGLTAPNFTSGPSTFCSTGVALVPATNANETAMIQCSSFGFGNAATTMSSVPNGSYNVEFYVWEDNFSEVFTPSLNGTALPTIVSGGPGTWSKQGPYPVTVTNNQISLTATGGASNFSGIIVSRPTSPPPVDTTPPTVVSVVPGNGAPGVAVGVVPVVTFSEPVVPGSGVTLSVDGGAAVATTVAAVGNTVVVTPLAPLAALTTYRISVGTAVLDTVANPIAAASFTTFTTAPGDSIRPTIVSVAPADAATGVAVGVVPVVTFSEPVVPGSGVTLSVDGGGTVAATVSVVDRTVMLTPSVPLAFSTTYRLSVGTSVVDAAGNAVAAASSTTFTTAAPAPDTTPPTVVSVAPVNAATGVARAVAPVVTFSEPVVPGSGVSLSVDGGAAVAATVSVVGSTVVLTPLAPLDFSTTYRLSVGTTVVDVAGNAVPVASSTTFTTLAAPDTTAPTVVSVAPPSAATGVATSVVPVVTFSEPVVPGSGVSLSVNGGAAVAATITAVGNTAVVTPSAPLTTGTTYRISVATSVVDAAGNAVAAASFTTFTVAGVLPPTTDILKVSRSTTRAPAVALEANNLLPNELVYIFLDSTQAAVSVRFYLDVPVTGTVFRTEGSAPWDFAGGSLTTASSYRVTLAAGTHVVRAVLTRANGTTQTYSSTFTVGNTPPPVDTIRPTVVAVAPVNAAMGVARSVVPEVTFSEPVLPGSGVSLSVDGGALVPTTMSTLGASVLLTPTAPLAFATTYRISVGTSVVDGAGNAVLTASSTTFTTLAAPPVDTTPPTVVSVAPLNAATGVARSVVPVVTFSEPVVPGSGVSLTVDSGAAVAATTSVVGNTVVLTPAALLIVGTTYRISVGTSVIDAAGNALAVASSTIFTTVAAPPVDTTPPTVVSVVPLNAATAVAAGVVPVVTFSEPVVPGAGVSLSVDGGAAVAAAVTTAGNSVVITPAAALTLGATYRISVGTTVVDAAGNAVLTASFTTFTVATVAPPTTDILKVSLLASRAPSVALESNTWVRGTSVYVFLDTPQAAVSVRFYLDVPTTGAVFRTEGTAPWDFAGGAIATANPYLNNLAVGTHTIRAVLTRANGTTQTYTSTFTVV